MNPVNSLTLVFVVLMAGSLCWLATRAMRRWAPSMGLVDTPNERSSHVQPTPRGGGLSFVVVAPILTVAVLFMPGISMPPGMPALICGALVVAGVSLVDDRWRLPVLVRFGAHGAGALIILAGGGYLHEVALPGGILLSLGSWGLPLTFIWIVGLTNAYNFMDGIDGLAAGQAVVAAVTMAWLSLLRGADVAAWAMLVISGSVLGFLLHNWPPAKIFMGDVGSAFLGFTFASWAILARGTGTDSLPFLAWAVVLAPFIFDTTTTLISRIVRRQRWYQSHCEHFYQRLIRRGWSHLAVTSLYLGITAFLGIVTIAYYGYHKISSFVYVSLVILPLFGIVPLVRIVEARQTSISEP